VSELVLIVDDDERNAKLVRDVLEAAGMRTMTAGTAAAALVLARDHLPDLVLMDLRLPDLDGAEAARRLRGEPVTAAIPVVALSALPSDDATGWLRDAGFAGYLEKPIDVPSLPGQVRAFSAQGLSPAKPGC
jgi:two-component system, cell cycle response regulator DivK